MTERERERERNHTLLIRQRAADISLIKNRQSNCPLIAVFGSFRGQHCAPFAANISEWGAGMTREECQGADTNSGDGGHNGGNKFVSGFFFHVASGFYKKKKKQMELEKNYFSPKSSFFLSYFPFLRLWSIRLC